ncbi:MAG: SDR family oxidoreductase [Erysipelotrichaceae bacterium]|nr:SDR family oxidoreductase [Erysipelotrichaceae bacterium]
MDLGLKGKYAIITGGTSGIGAGIGRVLASEGCNLIPVWMVNDEQAANYKKEIESTYGVSCSLFKYNIAVPENVDKLFAELEEQFDHVDILVNNAAGGYLYGQKTFDEITYDEWQSGIEGILNHVFYMSRCFVALARKRNQKGNIVNISAKAAFVSVSKPQVPYGPIKGAVAALSRRMAHELIDYGITVNCLIPGYVRTENHYADPNSESYKKREALLRIGWATPEDIGNIVAFYCSEKSRQIIGDLIDCSGGTMF